MKYFLLLLGLLSLSACRSAESVDRVTLLDGTETTLDDEIAGRPAIVNFWAGWCVFCKEELPFFENLAREHPEIAVIGVNLQESPEAARKYWENGGYTFPTLLDPTSELKRRFDVFTQPTTIFLNADGKILSKKNGPLTEEELAERVHDLTGKTTVLPALSGDSSPVPPLLSGWYQGEVRHLIPLQDILSGGPPKDGIPSIDTPKFTRVNDATFLGDGDLGLLLTIGNDTRFYPFRILNWHEIVNDTVGGKPVAITYCPLCATAIVYDRTISGGISEFGVSGFLYQSNLLMYDRLTTSLWNQSAGQAVVGPLTGEKLKAIRGDIVRFSTVQKEHPTARVLSTETGFRRDYSRDPYQGYAQDSGIYFPVRTTDARLHAKDVVYGIVVNRTAKAYPLSILQKSPTLTDNIGGSRIRIVYDARSQSVTFRNVDTNEEIIPLYGFWFSWVAQHPDTELFAP